MFWRKKINDTSKNSINSDEYERLAKKFIELGTEIRVLKTEHDLLKTDVANLRGKFNQRLKGLKQEEEQEQKKETETINNGELLAFG